MQSHALSHKFKTREGLMTALESIVNEEDLIPAESFEEGDTGQRMDIIVEAINKLSARFSVIHTMVNHASDGLDTRIEAAQDQSGDNNEIITELKKENSSLKREVEILKGYIIKQHSEIDVLRSRTTELVARSMSANLTITGILEEENENCKELVLNFIRDIMKLECADDQLLVAHRLGENKEDSQCPMIIKCTYKLKELLLDNKTKLAKKTNTNDIKYYINKQLPDQWNEEKREQREEIAKAKKEAKKTKQEISIKMVNNKLLINNQPVIKHLMAPKPQDLFVDSNEQDKIEKIKVHNSNALPVRKCSFTAYAVKCSSMTEVRRAYVKMRQIYTSAEHIPAAYQIKNGEGYQDDREFGASHKMLKTLQAHDVKNVAVFVVRFYGGEHLGPRRHEAIKQVVEEVIAKIKH